MFKDRDHAGCQLAERLLAETLTDPVVFALPRGGVPVALPVARALGAPLELLLVRKLGMPGQSELAAGAVVEGEPLDVVFNDGVLRMGGLTKADFEPAIAEKKKEIADRRVKYLKGRSRTSAKGRTAVVVDDGVATGATARAALKGLALQSPAKIVLALPVGPEDVLRDLERLVDQVICLEIPEPFYAVGAHYREFRQVSDDEVVTLMDAYENERKNK
ncbi:MAG: phosphoribosyltransferase [Paracoccaceae bacterium]|nr:phosphoribosyltransferase [Paracoccaceae bacterium]